MNHNHQEDSDDSCPATCIFACCGMSITYEPIVPLSFTLNTNISMVLRESTGTIIKPFRNEHH